MNHERNPKTSTCLSLQGFRFDPATGRVTTATGKIVHLRKQSAEVLRVLAATPGQIVGKEELIEAVWPGIATTDDSLVQCIADIRRTLDRKVIETFPKRGYRLRTGPAVTADTGHKRWARLGGSALALAVLAGAVLIGRPFGPAARDAGFVPIVPPAVQSARTIAVLPFLNLSGDPDLRFFSDGLSDDLVTDLSGLPGLTVISQASSFDFPDAEVGFGDIADELGVRYLVRGTVRHHEDRIRINVALVDSRDSINVWAERFDRSRQNPFDVQDDIVSRIMDALSLELGTEEAVQRRIEPDAYYMLLRGLEPLRAHTAAGNAEARAYFERALDLDPEYARAHANIALTHAREIVFRYAREVPPETIETGVEAAITAIRLDPGIPDAYLALATLNLALGEHANALASARKSIQLDANFSEGYAILAEVGVHGGDLDEALAAIRHAKLLHPHYPFTYDWVEGHILFQMGRYREAGPYLERAVGASPDFFRVLIVLAANHGQLGDVGLARESLEKARVLSPDFSVSDEVEQSGYLLDDRRQRLNEGLQAAL